MWTSGNRQHSEGLSARPPRWRILGWATAAMLLTPMAAISGLVAADADRLASRKPVSYNLRCWQDGKLILEETYVTLPKTADPASTRLQVMDRNNQPMYVMETRNATCLVQVREERERSGLR